MKVIYHKYRFRPIIRILNNKGRYHNLNGPAYLNSNGIKGWYVNGQLHRINGPALIYSDGRKRWYINNIKYSKEQFFDKLNTSQKLKFLNNPQNF